MAKTFDWRSFDSKRLVYSPQTQPNGNVGKKVIVKYLDPKTNQPVDVRWQTPRLRIPFGVSRYPPPGQGDDTTSVKYSLPQNISDKEYMDFLQDLDKRNLQAIHEHQGSWFPEKGAKSLEVLEAIYNPIVKPPPDGKDYDPSTRPKCPYRASSDQMQTKFWNENREQIPYTNVLPQSEAVAVIEFPCLWFINKGCGATLQVNQAKVYATSQRYNEYAIEDDDDNVTPMQPECPVDD